ncbi:MAG TPA: hypothetical protein V6C85_19930 [Allocoleopsis sp.]
MKIVLILEVLLNGPTLRLAIAPAHFSNWSMSSQTSSFEEIEV